MFGSFKGSAGLYARQAPSHRILCGGGLFGFRDGSFLIVLPYRLLSGCGVAMTLAIHRSSQSHYLGCWVVFLRLSAKEGLESNWKYS